MSRVHAVGQYTPLLVSQSLLATAEAGCPWGSALPESHPGTDGSSDGTTYMTTCLIFNLIFADPTSVRNAEARWDAARSPRRDDRSIGRNGRYRWNGLD